jgi:hypothetical protein
VLWLALAASASPASANTYTVGTTSDPSSTTCATPPCSLRQLIIKAEMNPFPPDTIFVPAGTYTLSLGALGIASSVNIVGAGAGKTTIAEPVPADRSTAGDHVFFVQAAGAGSTPVVSISGVTITGGTANIVTTGTPLGGDVVSSGNLTLTDDVITNGFACSGGGLANAGGTLIVDHTLVAGNTSACSAGAGDDSGGIVNYGVPGTPDMPGHLVVVDSTVTGNAARLGGGIFSWNDPTNTIAISNSTIAGNITEDIGAYPARGPGAGLAISTGTAEVTGSVIAGNLEMTGGVTTPTNCNPGGGAIQSLGYNLEGGTDCGFGSIGDVQNTNPLLGGLSNNGGPTETMQPFPGSKAINGANPAGCTDIGGEPVTTDQRGVARPQGSACDIGAFEFRVPTLSGLPSVTGTVAVGDGLACHAPSVSSPDQAPTVDIAWLRDGTSIASGAGHTIGTADERHRLSCRVTASDAAGSASATSAGAAVPVPPKPTIKITSAKVSSSGRSASFKFRTTGASGSRCALAAKRRPPRYHACKSPETYAHLKNGSYTFSVEATGPGGTSKPATHSFKIS